MNEWLLDRLHFNFEEIIKHDSWNVLKIIGVLDLKRFRKLYHDTKRQIFSDIIDGT
jgi:hypothetical protein